MEADKTRTQVELTLAESEAIEDFRKADRRQTTANAIIALALIGLDSWRKNGRPQAQRLTPEPPEAA